MTSCLFVHCVLQGVVHKSDSQKASLGPRADVHGDQGAQQD